MEEKQARHDQGWGSRRLGENGKYSKIAQAREQHSQREKQEVIKGKHERRRDCKRGNSKSIWVIKMSSCVERIP